MKNIEDVTIQKIDYLKQVEFQARKARDVASKEFTKEEMKIYDLGAKHMMNILESIIKFPEGEKDRLIYQKQGEHSTFVEYIKLTDVLGELEIEWLK